MIENWVQYLCVTLSGILSQVRVNRHHDLNTEPFHHPKDLPHATPPFSPPSLTPENH